VTSASSVVCTAVIVSRLLRSASTWEAFSPSIERVRLASAGSSPRGAGALSRRPSLSPSTCAIRSDIDFSSAASAGSPPRSRSSRAAISEICRSRASMPSDPSRGVSSSFAARLASMPSSGFSRSSAGGASSRSSMRSSRRSRPSRSSGDSDRGVSRRASSFSAMTSSRAASAAGAGASRRSVRRFSSVSICLATGDTSTAVSRAASVSMRAPSASICPAMGERSTAPARPSRRAADCASPWICCVSAPMSARERSPVVASSFSARVSMRAPSASAPASLARGAVRCSRMSSTAWRIVANSIGSTWARAMRSTWRVSSATWPARPASRVGSAISPRSPRRSAIWSLSACTTCGSMPASATRSTLCESASKASPRLAGPLPATSSERRRTSCSSRESVAAMWAASGPPAWPSLAWSRVWDASRARLRRISSSAPTSARVASPATVSRSSAISSRTVSTAGAASSPRGRTVSSCPASRAMSARSPSRISAWERPSRPGWAPASSGSGRRRCAAKAGAFAVAWLDGSSSAFCRERISATASCSSSRTESPRLPRAPATGVAGAAIRSEIAAMRSSKPRSAVSILASRAACLASSRAFSASPSSRRRASSLARCCSTFSTALRAAFIEG